MVSARRTTPHGATWRKRHSAGSGRSGSTGNWRRSGPTSARSSSCASSPTSPSSRSPRWWARARRGQGAATPGSRRPARRAGEKVRTPMSSFDVHPDEMHSDLAPADDAIEATLAGRVPADRPDLAVLATFATEVRTAFEEGPAPRVSGALARLFDTGLATSAADAPGITTTGDRSG